MSGKPIHGLSRTRINKCWRDMKQRCLNPKHKWYPEYGGRGITVCDEWMKFMPFYEWSMQNGYSDGLTIDRIDNNKGYCPENCRWATWKQQCEHKRRPRRKNLSENVGIEHTPCGRYRARVHRKEGVFNVGSFATVEEARAARKEFIRRNNL